MPHNLVARFRSKWVDRGHLSGLLLLRAILSLVTCSLCVFCFAYDPIEVQWREGLLSVDADNAPISWILQEIVAQTGMEVEGTETLQERVSVHLSRVFLSQGLQKLLIDFEYAIVGDATSNPRQARLVVYGRAQARNDKAATFDATARKSDSSRIPPSGPAADEVAPEDSATVTVNGEPPVREEDQAQRLSALHASATKGETEDLRKAMEDPDALIRSKAFEALAALDSQQALDTLLGSARKDDPEVRLQAIQFLDQNGLADETTVLTQLREALGDADQNVKGYAIEALATRGGAVAIGYLREALRDADSSVRAMIIENLSEKEESSSLLQGVPPSFSTTPVESARSEEN